MTSKQKYFIFAGVGLLFGLLLPTIIIANFFSAYRGLNNISLWTASMGFLLGLILAKIDSNYSTNNKEQSQGRSFIANPYIKLIIVLMSLPIALIIILMILLFTGTQH